MNALARHRILFVDDDQQWRDAASTSLAEAGFDVLTAADGSEAMRKAAAGPLALMIVDEDLAGEKGTMLAWFLRHNHPGVPTILHTTTDHDADATSDQMRQTADQCLPKGSIEELIVNVGCLVR